MKKKSTDPYKTIREKDKMKKKLSKEETLKKMGHPSKIVLVYKGLMYFSFEDGM